MNTGQHDELENRLRAAYQSATRTVKEGGIRPAVLRQPVRRVWRFAAFAPAAAVTPAAAALAVVAVIAGAVALPWLLSSGTRSTGTSLAGQRFIAVLTESKHTSGEELLIEAAGTSQVTDVVAPPAGMTWAAVAGAGNSTTIVAAAADSRTCTSRLYYITPPRTGHAAGLVPVPVPVITGMIGTPQALAVSADGKTVAYASAPRGRVTNAGQLCGFGRMVLSVAVAGSQPRQRMLPGQITAYNLSLSPDGGLLSYIADTSDPAVGKLEGLWLVPTRQGPGTTLPAGRQLLADTGSIFAAGGVLPAGGKAIYIITFRPGNFSKTTFTLSEYRTADGAVLRTVHAWPASMQSPRSLAIAGNQLLSLPLLPANTGYRVDLGSGRGTSFPVFAPPDYVASSVAW